ncbi:hypothetical protein DRN74_01990 [Candidatus Micrarchaeota archaeon]|nr:MAG: hypothetical protein DRN74_01990 [Candidatus Micrarchaeota archaeon]
MSLALPLPESFLFDISIIIVIATIFAYFTRLLRQPLILGYILAGVFIGPLGLGIVTNSAEMVALSELGIAFLLFGAALEIDISKLKGVANVSVLAGLLQVGLTIVFGFLASMFLGLDIISATYVSVILAFSSTMVVVKLLTDNFAINSLHGRLMIGLLVVQDILAIVAISFLDNLGKPLSMALLYQIILNGLGLLALAVLINKLVLVSLLRRVAKSQELFFLTVVSTCFVFMGFSYSLGFSIAIGAFIAGISLSMFRYNVEISGEVRSLRNFFSTLFFVSLGMQLTTIGRAEVSMLLLFLFIAIFVKPLIISLVYLLLGYGGKLSLRIGLSLAQVSEFSFIIAAAGVSSGQLSPELFSVVTTVIIVSVLLTPYLFRYHSFIYDILWAFEQISNISVPLFFRRRIRRHTREHELLPRKSIVLIGCDKMGERILNELGDTKKLLVVDYNPDVIENLSRRNIYSIYGDAYSDAVIKRMNVETVKVFISTIPDSQITAALIKRIKKLNPKVAFLARANFTDDAIDLYKAGADMVIMPDIVAGQRMAEYIRLLHRNPQKIQEIKKRHLEYLRKEIKQHRRHFLDKLIFND